jgi:hypothetical protein
MAERRILNRIVLERFKFTGLCGRRSWCGLALIPRSDGRIVVVASEREDNPGTSVTNACEELATMVVQTFGLDARKVIWIEHYPPGKIHGKHEDWDLVTFGETRWDQDFDRFVLFDGPTWRRMQAADWHDLGLDPATVFL